MFRVSLCVFKLENNKGHLRWKVTDLVRAAGVSRTLVYRYFGGSKEEIMTGALRVFTNDFYGFTGQGKALSFPRRIERARAQVFKYPEAILFYQTWRSRESELREEFIRIENKFRRDLRKLFSKCTDSQILLLHTCIHGLVTAPFLTPEQSLQVCIDLEKKLALG